MCQGSRNTFFFILSIDKYFDNTITRITECEGKLGLIYTSEYGYASTNQECATNMHGYNSSCKENN